MKNPKMLAIVLMHFALAAFFLVAIWPVLKGDSDNYNTKTVEPIAVPIAEPVIVLDEQQAIADKTPKTSEPLVNTEIVAPAVFEDLPKLPIVTTPTVGANTYEVKAQVTAFDPLVVFIHPGDQIAWSNMNGHDTQSLEGFIPEGADMWNSSLGEDFQRTFTVEGVYLYKCTPHFGMGMSGAIVVGNPTNMADIVATNQVGATKRLVKKVKKAISTHTF